MIRDLLLAVMRYVFGRLRLRRSERRFRLRDMRYRHVNLNVIRFLRNL